MKELLIIAGSESDRAFVEKGLEVADELGINYEFKIYSAHRNLVELLAYLDDVTNAGKTRVIIAVAGLSAALPGVIAAKVKFPVIGVPINVGALNGIDALLSIAQMPKGVPVGCMGIGNQGMINSVLFAQKILNA